MDDAQFEGAKQRLTKRFKEFMDLHRFLLKKAKEYYRYGTLVRLVIIILGAVSAGQATLKDQMGATNRNIILFFSVLAVLMTIGGSLVLQP